MTPAPAAVIGARLPQPEARRRTRGTPLLLTRHRSPINARSRLRKTKNACLLRSNADLFASGTWEISRFRSAADNGKARRSAPLAKLKTLTMASARFQHAAC